MPAEILIIVGLVVAVIAGLVWFLLRRRAAPKTIRTDFPSSGLLVPEGVLRPDGATPGSIWQELEKAATPVALEYQPLTDLELSKYHTVPVNASIQQSMVNVVRALNPKSATLYRVVLPKGSNLVRAVGADGFRGFVRNGTGIAKHALLKPVAVGGAIAAGWPVFAVAGTVLMLDMAAQHELRAHQRRVEGILGRQEERYFIERIKDQRSADAQLTRAISAMLDGRQPALELAVKSADDEFHRAELFLQKYRGIITGMADADGTVDFRRLEEALGGKVRDLDYFVRELHLSRAALALRRKALIADAAAFALADPANPYGALRSFFESQGSRLELAEAAAQDLTERLAQVELKGRWYDRVAGLWRGPDKSVVARQARLRSQVAPVAAEPTDELRFISTPSGEIRQVISSADDTRPTRE